MSYLFINDFKKSIQSDNLNQVINNDPSILGDAMLNAQTEATEYLIQKYMLEQELADTNPYDLTKTYNPGDRVYLDASAYDALSEYILNTLVTQAGKVYKCSTAIVVPEAFTIDHWTLLGTQLDIYSVPVPYPSFNSNTFYKVGAIVWWKGLYYTCKIATMRIDHAQLIQYTYYNAVPQANILPDDPDNGVKYWGSGVSSPVTAGTLPSSPWKFGDNRNRNLVRHCVAIALFIIHKRISPRNIPELRDIDYRGVEDDRINAKDGLIYPEYCALGWLQAAQGTGRRTISLPLIQPRAGGQIRWGSNIKNVNGY